MADPVSLEIGPGGALAQGAPAAARMVARTRARGDAMPSRGLTILYAAVFTIVALLALIPLGALILGSFRDAAPGLAGHWTLGNWAALASPGVVDTLVTTFSIAVATTLGAVTIGTTIAFIVLRTDFAWPNLMTMALGLSFYFPSFILAMAWIIIGSPGGLINSVVVDRFGLTDLGVDIYSKFGIGFVMILHMVPFSFLTMRGPIAGMDPSYEEAARASGAGSFGMLVRVTLPLLSYALGSCLLLTFIMSLEQFGIPVLIGIPGRVTVLATQVYLLCSFPPTDYGLAAAVGLTLSAATAVAIMGQRRLARGGRQVVTTGKAGRLAPMRLGRWRWLANTLCIGYVILALVLPTIILIYTSLIKYFTGNPFEAAYTLRNYAYMIESYATQRALWNTLIVSGFGAAIGVTLGAAVSYCTVRLKPAGHRLLDIAVMIPFGVPGIVLGLGLLWAYAFLPVPLYGTLAIIVLAYVTRFLPYATEAIGGRLVQIDRSLEEAAWTSGASRPQGLARILLPLSRPALQSGYLLLFMAFFREISATILLFSSSTAVLSVAIWEAFEQANWGLASALSLVASVIMFVIMSLLLWLMPSARTR